MRMGHPSMRPWFDAGNAHSYLMRKAELPNSKHWGYEPSRVSSRDPETMFFFLHGDLSPAFFFLGVFFKTYGDSKARNRCKNGTRGRPIP
jgi:hypothetical protein